MAKPSRQMYQGPRHARDRQTTVPTVNVNRKNAVPCPADRHAFGVPESTVWQHGKQYSYYTCACCPATQMVEAGKRP